jgi:hypothetical protein
LLRHTPTFEVLELICPAGGEVTLKGWTSPARQFRDKVRPKLPFDITLVVESGGLLRGPDPAAWCEANSVSLILHSGSESVQYLQNRWDRPNSTTTMTLTRWEHKLPKTPSAADTATTAAVHADDNGPKQTGQSLPVVKSSHRGCQFNELTLPPPAKRGIEHHGRRLTYKRAWCEKCLLWGEFASREPNPKWAPKYSNENDEETSRLVPMEYWNPERS